MKNLDRVIVRTTGDNLPLNGTIIGDPYYGDGFFLPAHYEYVNVLVEGASRTHAYRVSVVEEQ